MKTPYEIKLWPRTSDEDKQVEISRIDALFSKIEDRYWKWREDKHSEGIAELTSKNIMSREEAEQFFDKQHDGEVKDLARVFENLNAHYTRLYLYAQKFNNTEIRVAIAEDKKQYKEFCVGLKSVHRIVIDYKPGPFINRITIWYGSKKKSKLEGINGYILDDICEQMKERPGLFPCSNICEGEEGFNEIKRIIQQETSRHIFEDRYTPKSDLQPFAERCSDLYSDIMKHKAWILDRRLNYSGQVGEMVIELLGLNFPTRKGLNKKDTFINALHPIHSKEVHSLSDIIEIDFE